MRVPTSLPLAAALWLSTACVPKDHSKPDWLEAPDSYDPVNKEGLTFNKAGLDKLTLLEGEERDAHVQSLMAEGAFVGQAQCKSGAHTREDQAEYGDYVLTCNAGTILFDIDVAYHVFTTRELGKPLSAGSYVEFTGTLVNFDYQDSAKPRHVVAMVKVGDNLEKLER